VAAAQWPASQRATTRRPGESEPVRLACAEQWRAHSAHALGRTQLQVCAAQKGAAPLASPATFRPLLLAFQPPKSDQKRPKVTKSDQWQWLVASGQLGGRLIVCGPSGSTQTASGAIQDCLQR